MAEFAYKEKKTEIPVQLKEHTKQNKGVSFADVRTRYNSYKPVKSRALAYSQGTRPEIGTGQNRHMHHELGHVVQQKLEFVRAHAMDSSGMAMNTDAGMERQPNEIGTGRCVDIGTVQGNNVVQLCGSGEGTGQKSFSSSDIDWSGYPNYLYKPTGPFVILEGDEYRNARDMANKENAKIHRKYPQLRGYQIHEVHPVKFGGNPVALNNKVILTLKEHSEVTAFWNSLLSKLKG